MRKVARKSLITVVAASGALAVSGGYAHADSGTSGAAAHSPGVLSGNTVQVPVHVPVNACGNTVNVVGLLNPASGNSCGNGSGGGHGSGPSAGVKGGTHDSPGVGSGNSVQVSVDIPINACGNSANVVGALNPATGAECGDAPSRPGEPESPGGPESPSPSQPPGDGTTPPSHEPGGSGGPGSTQPGGDEGSGLHPQ
ncbi:chaplin, partial [Streptomyces purpurogeneiscleroticus]|uniref:chaplin n=1 Tax=Streptomyces purpurogeneiscleroticus TaxID=68259 RepID=UPI001CBBB72E